MDNIYVFIMGCIALETNIMLIVTAYNLIRIMFQKSKRVYALLIGVMFVTEYFILQIMARLIDEFNPKGIGFDNTTVEIILLQSVITIVTLAVTQMVRRWEKRTLTKASLKEGLDSIPVGLLFYWKGGAVKLVNMKMDSISRSLFGEGIYSGNEFWERLKQRKMNIRHTAGRTDRPGREDDGDDYESDNECLVRLNDGSVYSFKRNICIFENHELYELTASDVSDEQLLNEKLKVKQIKVNEIKKRLKGLNRDIEKMTVEKEILETKSKVHDDLGKTLIMSKRFLETGDEQLGTEVLKQWSLNTMLLRGEEERSKPIGDYKYDDGVKHTENKDEGAEVVTWSDRRNDLETIIDDIEKAGLRVSIEGEPPKDLRHRELFISALRTCSTNALRHGNGTELYIKLAHVKGRTLTSFREREFLQIEIGNNGSLPEPGFTEGGGLGNLRNTIESAGGSMRISLVGVFTVIIRLPLQREG